MRRFSSLLLLFVLALASCRGAPQVSFAPPTAPIDAQSYKKIHARWTRHSHISTGVIDTAWDGHTTLLSDEWRTAYVGKVTKMRRLTDAQRLDLEAAQRADATKYVDFVVQLYTLRWEWSDLASTRSLWTLTMRDDQGHELGKPEISIVPEKIDLLEELFPPTTPFTRCWRVRFPRPLADNAGQLLNPETRWVTLTFAGPLGSGESRWDSGASSTVRPAIVPPKPPDGGTQAADAATGDAAPTPRY